jgi:protein TonB
VPASETIARTEKPVAAPTATNLATETVAEHFDDDRTLSPPVPQEQSQYPVDDGAHAAPLSALAPLSPHKGDSSLSPADAARVREAHAGSSDSAAASASDTVAFNHPTVSRGASTKPNYHWLMELLRRRILSLQVYPSLARTQGWEGIVVVKTTIKSDGSLVEAVVTKSSGYSALDEDALSLMRRVCPIRLPQDLGLSQIAVLIPIRYRLEQ